MKTGNWFKKMKLRIKGNSIRFRLLRTEVEQFALVGQISDAIEFGSSGFLKYSLVRSPGISKVAATLHGNDIAISVPEDVARNWTSSDEVGFESEQPIGDGESLSIIVEKDFACLDRPNDPDRADAYPNPHAECGQPE